MRGYRLELLAQVTVTRRYVFEFSARAGVRVHLPLSGTFQLMRDDSGGLL